MQLLVTMERVGRGLSAVKSTSTCFMAGTTITSFLTPDAGLPANRISSNVCRCGIAGSATIGYWVTSSFRSTDLEPQRQNGLWMDRAGSG